MRKIRQLPGTRRKKRKPLETDPSYYGLDYEKISFYSRRCEDVVLLRGWYIPCKDSKKCIIMVHGINSNRVQIEANLLEIAKALVDCGFNVLTFDLRAHGESAGNHLSLGYYEAYDVLGARDFVVNKKKIPPKNIGMLGFSYGAMIIILAARKENISGVIADSCPGDTLKLTLKWMSKLHIPLGLFRPLTRLLGKILVINADGLNVKEALKKITSPVFFIHGTEDDFPLSWVVESYRAKHKNELDRIWVVGRAGHLGSYKTYPEKYIEKIVDFFNKTLGPA